MLDVILLVLAILGVLSLASCAACIYFSEADPYEADYNEWYERNSKK